MKDDRLLPLLVIAAAILGCGKGSHEMSNPVSLDSPDVLAVVFHPRPESTLPVRETGFERVEVPIESGVVLGGRFYPAATGGPTVLFFHGNGEIVADYADLAPVYTKLGINFMPMDYRGYGRSTGRPSVTSMLRDSHALFEFARAWLKERGYRGPLFVMGRSLGSAPALELAEAYPDQIDGLVIESGFADAVALVMRLGWRPRTGRTVEDTLLRHPEKIRRYTGPTLIIHGTEDFIIPISEAEVLYEASGSARKKLLRIPDAGHNNLLAVGFEEYVRALSDVVRQAPAAE